MTEGFLFYLGMLLGAAIGLMLGALLSTQRPAQRGDTTNTSPR